MRRTNIRVSGFDRAQVGAYRCECLPNPRRWQEGARANQTRRAAFYRGCIIVWIGKAIRADSVMAVWWRALKRHVQVHLTSCNGMAGLSVVPTCAPPLSLSEVIRQSAFASTEAFDNGMQFVDF